MPSCFGEQGPHDTGKWFYECSCNKMWYEYNSGAEIPKKYR